MFIDDLVININQCKYFLYADNVVMYKSLGKFSKIEDIETFKQDIASTERWCLRNELTINIKKTKLQFFLENRNTDCIAFENVTDCFIYNQKLTYESTFKYLGVDIDRNLNMKSFYESMYKLANHKLIRPSLTVNAALAVGKSMIISLIDYGNIFLTALTREDQCDLQKLQNRVLRCCLDIVDPMDINVTNMHNIVNVKLVDIRRKHNLLIMVHKGILENNFAHNMVNHERNTRYNDGQKVDLIEPRNETT